MRSLRILAARSSFVAVAQLRIINDKYQRYVRFNWAYNVP